MELPSEFSFFKENPEIQYQIIDGLTLPYLYRASSDRKKGPRQYPLIISLHSMRSNKNPSKARFSDWNHLQPFDCYGYKNETSYWVGSYPEFSLLSGIISVVEQLKSKGAYNGELYIKAGSSSSYAGVYLAMRLNARALYLSDPILSSKMDFIPDLKTYKRYTYVFNNSVVDFDAVDLLKPNTKTVFYIVDQRFGYKNLLRNNSLKFINRCEELGINFKYEVSPDMGHSVPYTLRHVLKFFSSLPKMGVTQTGFPDLAHEEGYLFDDVSHL